MEQCRLMLTHQKHRETAMKNNQGKSEAEVGSVLERVARLEVLISLLAHSGKRRLWRARPAWRP
jgi:hypothetical protein